MHQRYIAEDHALALHGVYVALFRARQTCPAHFRDNDITRVMTGLMASKPWSWRVIGITPAALDVFAQHEFNRPTGEIQRGHLVNRVATSRQLFDRDAPAERDDFLALWLQNDRTVLMRKGENTHGREVPNFIEIENDDAFLFPSGTLIGWQHRKAERDFLRKLHELQISTR